MRTAEYDVIEAFAEFTSNPSSLHAGMARNAVIFFQQREGKPPALDTLSQRQLDAMRASEDKILRGIAAQIDQLLQTTAPINRSATTTSEPALDAMVA
jgi:hypothetical protein